MAKIMESIAVVNSAARTAIALAVAGGLGYGGWYGYQQYNAGEIESQRAAEALADAQERLDRAASELQEKNALLLQKDTAIQQLNSQVKQQEEEIQRLDTAMRLLKVDHRLARITVLEQTTDPTSGETSSLVQFQELNEQGQAVDKPRQFRIKGDLVYVDSWVVKFDDKYVEQADIDRSTSLVLFRRLFGEFQEPRDGYTLDEAGARPEVYGRGGKMSDFEKRIWDDFWTVANDDTLQGQLGIRAAHGDAPFIRVQKGKTYRVELRASDGLSITPEGDAPKPLKPAA